MGGAAGAGGWDWRGWGLRGRRGLGYAAPMNREQAAAERKQRIWRAIAAIPAGRVCSYGGVARLAGLGNGARQTAWALRHLPRNTRIPWHRVINAQGKIAMPEGSRGYREQRRRLRQEGVRFAKNGRIADPAYWWRGE